MIPIQIAMLVIPIGMYFAGSSLKRMYGEIFLFTNFGCCLGLHSVCLFFYFLHAVIIFFPSILSIKLHGVCGYLCNG